MKRLIRQAIALLLHPRRELRLLNKRTLEDILADYLKMVLLVGAGSGIFIFISTVIKAAYFDLLLNADVQYLRMLNYSFGQVISIVFLYFFIGTFGIFLLSILLRIFIRIKYTKLLKILLCSMSPILVFGWIVAFIPGLSVWSAMLFFLGLKIGKDNEIKHDSIAMRD